MPSLMKRSGYTWAEAKGDGEPAGVRPIAADNGKNAYVKHGQLDHLPHLFDLLRAATHVLVGDVGLLLDLHETHGGVDLGGQGDLNLELLSVHTECRNGNVSAPARLCECRSASASTYPIRMPSSMSVGETFSPRSTTYLPCCLQLMRYLSSSLPVSSLPPWMIFVQRATCNPRRKSSDISSKLSNRCRMMH